jgi:hypothetical protein
MRAKPPTTCRTARIAAALLVMAAALPTAPSWAQGANDDTKAIAADPEDAAYWLRNREGWFWYRDPPVQPRGRHRRHRSHRASWSSSRRCRSAWKT